MTTEREKALGLALSQIEKRFGEGSVMKLGDVSGMLSTDIIPSGSLALDLALGVGGIPRGRITEIFGPESSGKTTLAQHIIAETQKQGSTAVYIDVEHALDLAVGGRDLAQLAHRGAVDLLDGVGVCITVIAVAIPLALRGIVAVRLAVTDRVQTLLAFRTVRVT